MQHRLFLSQETLDRWLTDAKVEVDGETMTLLPEGQSFRLDSALHFVEELTGGDDEKQLIGRVHSLESVVEMGGEHYADSVVLGELAYTVVEGFLGSPVSTEEWADATGPDLASAARAATGENELVDDPEVELLAKFFLRS